jgi:hypothetical protein
MDDNQPTTRRDVLSAEFDKLETEPAPVVEAEPAPVEAAPVEEPPKAGRTANRLRDEHGRLLPGKKEDSAPVEVKPVAAPATAQAQPAPAAEPIRPQRPSSWKKDYWEHWDKLDPKVADYILQREQQFSSGVSTYKQEADRAKELREALAPFEQDFQKAGVSPAIGVAKLANAHRELVNSAPEQRIQIFQRLAQEYGVPLQAVQSGQVDPVMQYFMPVQEQIRQLQGQFQTYQQQIEQQQQTAIQTELQSFAAQHEHFDSVRETMSGLLSAGLAQDLQSAYDAALALPQHSEIRQAMQQQQSAEESHRKAAEAAAIASRARGKVTSIKSANPSGTVVTNGAKKDRRAILSEAFDTAIGDGRV